MFKKIVKKIKKYNTIVIARHIGVDPDAMASQIALKESIKLTFPKKNVYAIGMGSTKFNYLGKLDKVEDIKDALLIVLDTPDKRRIDAANIDLYTEIIKIDHHPYIETFANIEYIDAAKSSTCEIIIDMIKKTKLKENKHIAELLFMGLVSDSNRFLFNNTTSKTFFTVSQLMKKYDFNLAELYANVYLRPLSEVRLQGYIEQHIIVTENGLGYIKLTNELLEKFDVDSSSAGNLVNNFNFIEEVIVWATISEDIKNEVIRINIRSRGPIINHIAEKYHGGGHEMASGARLQSFEETESLIEDLDIVCKKYKKEK
jgi:phosphoesterase RecJ-like protein